MSRTFLSLLLVLSLAGCGGGQGSGKGPAAAASQPLQVSPEDVLVVQAGTRASGPVITGSIQPETRADLRAEVSAVVTQVAKDNGDAVRRGELLLRLDDTSIRDQLDSALEAERASARAFEQAERNVQRLRTLQGQGMISLQALEDAEVRRNLAQSDQLAARARVVAARQQLQRTEVRAPFDGIVSERRASVGDTAQVGRELLKVFDPRSLRLEGLVSADRVGEIAVGQRVVFRVNGYPGVEFEGQVRRLDAAANAATRQLAVLVAITGRDLPRVAGLFAEGRIETGQRRVVAVPEASLLRDGEEGFVWKLADGQLRKAAVRLGERDARTAQVEVLAGLTEGERILRRPSGGLADGRAFRWAASSGAGAASAASPASASAPAASAAPSAPASAPRS